MIKKKKQSTARVWKAKHQPIVQRIKKMAGLNDVDMVNPKIIRMFVKLTHSRCSTRARNLLHQARLFELAR